MSWLDTKIITSWYRTEVMGKIKAYAPPGAKEALKNRCNRVLYPLPKSLRRNIFVDGRAHARGCIAHSSGLRDINYGSRCFVTVRVHCR